jgi:Uma2 family endonuclease
MKPDQTIPRYTYKDYASWGGDWELIHGYPHAMSPSPRLKHQLIGSNTIEVLRQAIRKNEKCQDCHVVYELDWIIHEETVVRPDIMVICGDTSDDFLRYPPTLIVEILSENTRLKDRTTKFDLYEQQGVRYYILADPDKEIIEPFELVDNRYKSNDQLDTFLLHEGYQIKVNLKNTFSRLS